MYSSVGVVSGTRGRKDVLEGEGVSQEVDGTVIIGREEE